MPCVLVMTTKENRKENLLRWKDRVELTTISFANHTFQGQERQVIPYNPKREFIQVCSVEPGRGPIPDVLHMAPVITPSSISKGI